MGNVNSNIKSTIGLEERAEQLKYEADLLAKKARNQNIRFTIFFFGILGAAIICMMVYC